MIASKASSSLPSSYPAHTNEHQNTGKKKVIDKEAVQQKCSFTEKKLQDRKEWLFSWKYMVCSLSLQHCTLRLSVTFCCSLPLLNFPFASIPVILHDHSHESHAPKQQAKRLKLSSSWFDTTEKNEGYRNTTWIVFAVTVSLVSLLLIKSSMWSLRNVWHWSLCLIPHPRAGKYSGGKL